MQLDASQIAQYEETGYLFFPSLLDKDEVSVLQGSMSEILERPGPEVIREKGKSDAARLVFGAHDYSEAFGRLSLLPRLVNPTRQLLKDDVYLHQSRMNPKEGFGASSAGGGAWDWHQDYSAWRVVDGMAQPRCMMTTVFIDDCTAAKSPLLLMPGTHGHGFIDSAELHKDANGYALYHLDQATVQRLADEHGIEALIGPAGSVAFIHSNLVHGSANNVSPWRRAIMYLIYNAVSNACTNADRPWFQNNRDFTALEPIGDDALRGLMNGQNAGRLT